MKRLEALPIGISTCPNDTFSFFALVHGKVSPCRYIPSFHDIAELNHHAVKGTYPIVKLSLAAFHRVLTSYKLLTSGGALGFGNGPLVVSKSPNRPATIPTIGIPGEQTTANALLSYFFPHWTDKKEILFSEIEQAILCDEIEAGVLIHETRFSFVEKGLYEWADLGKLWEEETQLPIPLGGIAVKTSLPLSQQQRIQEDIQKSVQYALAHPKEPLEYVREYAQELSDEVLTQHIQMFVNSFSVSLGEKGKKAIFALLKRQLNTSQHTVPHNVFISQ